MMSGPPRGDPLIRRLRVISALVFLGLIAFIVLDGQPDNPATLGSLVGAMLVTLGFELGFRYPVGPPRDDDRKGGPE